MGRYVTRTGHSVRIGKTTRKSREVKRPNVRPLPLHLQCHPQYLHKLSWHPDCREFDQPTGALLSVLPFSILFRAGRWLAPERGPDSTVEIVVDDCGTWYHHDTAFAFTWKKAAEKTGLTVNVYIL